MSAKAVLLICAQALLMKSALSQVIGAGLGVGLNGLGVGLNGLGVGLNGLGGCGCGGVASTGGGLAVSSASPCAPIGVSVLSENAYEGRLCAGGNLPFLSTVGIDGVLPTAGAGAVSYGCGNGAVGIASEGPIATGILAPGDFAPASGLVNGLGGIAGYGIGIDGYGLGGIAGYGIGIDGYGLGGIGYGVNGLGCGCGVY